ncbi:NAD(P)/FAD-dependent oxidoreductase [Roseibacillus persicicus]|uniref:FAD-dependent oxidoreductase n=1 Tax=Roseibacillus persicicus TaxID=454148 RepID=A0A918WLI0_9BACT|nr:hypothetical protein [Roseibacillus persicicus]GHC57875.1 FAD-dependent oxidoreductase [Roseibacillus persicicus]
MFARILSKHSIEIVGGGIAGLSLAVGLRRFDVPVVLREAGSYPRHRLCGEFVNGVSDETLGALGLSELFEGAKVHEEMTWWLKGRLIADTSMERPVRALSRWTMDERMRSRFVSLGGEVSLRDRAVPEPRPGRVWAAGRRLQKESEWLGLKAHFLGLETRSGLEMHLGDGGYVGLTPVEDGRVNVCGLFRKRRDLGGKGSERMIAYLAASGLDELAERLRDVSADDTSVSGIAGIDFGAQGHDPEILAIGDAERMIPPFTGNGMSMAFEAAECALQPLKSYSEGGVNWESAREQVHRKLAQRFNRRITLAKGLHRAILAPPAQEVLAAAAKPGLLPFAFLNRILT